MSELVDPGEPPPAMNMDDLIRMGGGGAMLTGTAPAKPWETPAAIGPKIGDGWRGRNIARRLKPITPSVKSMVGRPASPVSP